MSSRRAGESLDAESRLRFLEAVIECAAVGIITTETDGTVRAWNPAAEQLYGWSAADAIGRHISEVTLGAPPNEQVRDILARLGRGERLVGDFPQVRRNGTMFIARTTLSPLRDDGGAVAGFVGFVHDVSDEQCALEALRASERRNAAIFSAIPDQLFRMKRDGTFVAYLSPSIDKLVMPPDDFIGRRYDEIFPAEISGPVMDAIGAALDSGKLTTVEVDVPINGEVATFEGRVVPYEEDEVLALVRDVSELRRREELLESHVARRTNELQVLRSVVTAVSASLDIDQVVATLRTELNERVGIPSGAIFLGDAQGELALRSFWGMEELNAQHFQVLLRSLPDGDVRRSPRSLPPSVLAAALRWRSVLTVPLRAHDVRIGVLLLAEETPSFFTPELRSLLHTLGSEVAFAVMHARMYGQLAEANAERRELARQLIASEEEERRRFGHELHDEVGQLLTALMLSLDRVPAGDPRALDTARELAAALLARVRDLSTSLRPPMLDDLGLLPALLWLVGRFEREVHLVIRFEHFGLDRRFDSEIETAIYRIVQEALTNVARHAGVGAATVRVWSDAASDGGFVWVEVSDEGSGFDVQQTLASATAFGLRGMTERCELIGGELTIRSSPGAGTRLRGELPLAAGRGTKR